MKNKSFTIKTSVLPQRIPVEILQQMAARSRTIGKPKQSRNNNKVALRREF